MSNKKYWVWLSMVFGGGTYKMWRLMSILESVEEVCSDLLTMGEEAGLTSNEIKNIKAYSLRNAEELIAECDRRGITIITYSDPNYPNQLRFIADPPPILYCKGNTECLAGTKTVTCVGARKSSEYSLSVCNRICTELANNGYVIVSGFAVGIDITAHLAAAEAGRPTVCVLGCGVDVDYPKENSDFKEKILENGGVLVSEYPPGYKPARGTFPRRNRILSAIGRVTAVFEGNEKSGSLITARLAAEQGREIFVLPPADIFASSYRGNIFLLKEGAVPLTSSEDIMEAFRVGSPIDAEVKADAFEFITSKSVNAEAPYKHSLYGMAASKSVVNHSAESLPSSARKKADEKRDEKDFSDIEGVQKKIAELLRNKGRLHADIICTELNIDSSELMTELTELEILGIVKACPGRIYELV